MHPAALALHTKMADQRGRNILTNEKFKGVKVCEVSGALISQTFLYTNIYNNLMVSYYVYKVIRRKYA